MLGIEIDNELKEKCPNMVLGVISCNVQNSVSSDLLWEQIDQTIQNIRNNYASNTIKQHPFIKATRAVYKRTGKDPGRYRPAAEQLYRRVLQGKGLYKINTLVDLVNMISLQTGYSIGGFDREFINGAIRAGIGEENESYEAIGRGKLNVQGLPILRDSTGGIGTPTSDEQRTALRLETRSFLMNINAYTGKEDVIPVLEESVRLLEKYVNASNIITRIIE